MLEIFHSASLAQSVESSLFDVFVVGHTQLVENDGFLPRLKDPHTSAEKLACFVHVAKMW